MKWQEAGVKWRPIPHNGRPCDLCDEKPVGWVRINLPDRIHGGWLQGFVYMVCADHIRLGDPVYPDESAGGADDLPPAPTG